MRRPVDVGSLYDQAEGVTTATPCPPISANQRRILYIGYSVLRLQYRVIPFSPAHLSGYFGKLERTQNETRTKVQTDAQANTLLRLYSRSQTLLF